jgi:transcription elongation factor GreA
MDLGEPVLLTAEGLEKLKHDLEDARARRPALAERMKEAAQPGDIEDNPEFEQAKEEVQALDNRIYELEEMIGRAQLIAEHHSIVIEPGSVIEIEDDKGDVETWHLVGAIESDPGSGRISIDSPVGRALLGRRQGDKVSVSTPSGQLELRVKTVR